MRQHDECPWSQALADKQNQPESRNHHPEQEPAVIRISLRMKLAGTERHIAKNILAGSRRKGKNLLDSALFGHIKVAEGTAPGIC